MDHYIYEDGLESERLTTRKLVDADHVEWSAFFEDEEVLKFLPHFEATDKTERARYWIKRQQNRYENKLFGLQALTDKNTNRLIGMCGLLLQEVEGVKEIEVGYHLLKKYRGKGYASEAAKLFKEYAFKNNLSSTLISIIQVNNAPSQKVASGNGMMREKKCHWNGLDVFIYRVRK